MRKGTLCGKVRPGRTLVSALAAALFCPVLALTGCYTLPEPKISEKAVFAAAKEVIEGKYAYTAASEGQGFVVATTPVKMDGNSKTRKQISVVAQRGYTGSYEPVVRVRKLVEVGEPILSSNPETTDLGQAVPLAQNEWKALCYLPNEEEELTHEILKKLIPKGL